MSDSNMPVVSISTFIDIIRMQFEEDNLRPIFGLGKGGIGKTESIYNLAVKELNIGYIDIRLLLYSETDLKGIPYPDESHTSTIWLQNNILPISNRDGDKGILVFDEITSCSRSVRTAAYQLLNERKLGEYKLPDGWLVVCLGNGEDDGGDFEGMEGNFANRCSVFEIIHDIDSWKMWAFNNNINPMITSYISFKPSDLHSYNSDSETELLFASPRSWTAVSNIMKNSKFDCDNQTFAVRVMANLGQRVGQQFLAFCRFSNNSLDTDSIVKNGAMPTTDNVDQEIIIIAIGNIVKLVGDKIKIDMQNNNGAITQEAVRWTANGLKWMLKLRKEYAVMGIKDIISYDKSVMGRILMQPAILHECPELTSFSIENYHIFG